MPTYRSITISLTSQFDLKTIPEYLPPLSSSTRTSESSDPFIAKPPPIRLIDHETYTVSMYAPIYPLSQFWIQYSIHPPYPPHSQFYFKMFLNDHHIVSWGCGEKDGYGGKTVFALYQDPKRPGRIERRALCFGSEKSSNTQAPAAMLAGSGDVMVIKAYRCRGMVRDIPKLEQAPKLHSPISSKPVAGTARQPIARSKSSNKANDSESIRLVPAGHLTNRHPKRFYKFALLDPLDVPFANFRYLFHTWSELDRIGARWPSPLASTASSFTTASSEPASQPSPLVIARNSPLGPTPRLLPPTPTAVARQPLKRKQTLTDLASAAATASAPRPLPSTPQRAPTPQLAQLPASPSPLRIPSFRAANPRLRLSSPLQPPAADAHASPPPSPTTSHSVQSSSPLRVPRPGSFANAATAAPPSPPLRRGSQRRPATPAPRAVRSGSPRRRALDESEGRRALLTAAVADLMRTPTAVGAANTRFETEESTGSATGRGLESRVGPRAWLNVESRNAIWEGQEEGENDQELESSASGAMNKGCLTKKKEALGKFAGRRGEDWLRSRPTM